MVCVFETDYLKKYGYTIKALYYTLNIYIYEFENIVFF